jgi:hypothetical protein
MKHEAAAEQDTAHDHQDLETVPGYEPSAEHRKHTGHQESDIGAVGDKTLSDAGVDSIDRDKLLTDWFVKGGQASDGKAVADNEGERRNSDDSPAMEAPTSGHRWEGVSFDAEWKLCGLALESCTIAKAG